MTVGDALREGISRLSSLPSLTDPAHEARFLLAALLGKTESWLFAHTDTALPAEQYATVLEWFSRRSAGEPAHYIVGRCPFWGRDFVVDPAVLIPRPETELIVERALRLALSPGARVLDVGTGSGCLAVTLACERPQWLVTAVDRSIAALVVARENARRLGARVAFACADLIGSFTARYDLVVANLPYIPAGELSGLQSEIREHEPVAALLGGERGDELVLALLAQLPVRLAPGGAALLELGPGQVDTAAAGLEGSGLAVVERITDLGGVERVVVVRAAD